MYTCIQSNQQRLRESIQLVGIGGLDPVFEFRRSVSASFEKRVDELSGRVAIVMVPTSTWTYLLNDRVVSAGFRPEGS